MVRKSNRSNRSAKNKASSTARPAPKMQITKRVVDVKRHTIGYMINGQFYNVNQSRVLAGQGRISGVRVVGQHIQAENGRRRLGTLPMEIRN